VIAPLPAPGSSPAYGCADFLGGLGARKARVLRTMVIADPASPVVELLRRQTARFQPDGDHATIDAAQPPCGRMLPGSRSLRLDVTEARAKSEYDDRKPAGQRSGTARRLTERGRVRTRPPQPGGGAARTASAHGKPDPATPVRPQERIPLR
jgi:hypothetical protein